MTNLTTISNEVFNAERQMAMNNEFIRKELSLSEFEVVDNNHIRIDGTSIEVSDRAFGKLLGRLRIPKAFAKRFAESFGNDGLRQLVTMMKSMKATKNDQTVTLLVDPKKRTIIDILPAGYASISASSFFDFAERYIDQYNLGITNIGSDPYGGSHIDCVSQNGIFKVPGMDKEIFSTGVTFRNTPINGLQVSPYLNRLICTNGITSTTFAETFSLHQFSNKNIEEFNEAMIRMASTGFQPVGLADTIRKAHITDASLAEMQRAASAILSLDKNVDYNYIQRYVPIERAMKAYEMAGVDTTALTKEQMRNASSGMSVWDVVNGMTNFASNDSKYDINGAKLGNLMVTAGGLLTKRNYDTEALLNVNPFATSSLLTEDELSRMRGEHLYN